MSTKIINISLPARLLQQLDAAAKENYASRSDYIRESIVLRLKGQHIVDQWTTEAEDIDDSEEE